MRIHRAPDDEQGKGQEKPEAKPETKPEAKPAGPPTVPGVKATPLKHPSVIALEKKVAELEDKTDTLEGALAGVNELLEGLKIGGPSPVEIKQKKDAPAVKGGFLDDLEKMLWGN